MALVKCKECGNHVSTEAEACPQCGAKLTSSINFGRFIGLLFIFFILYLIFSPSDKSADTNTPNQTAQSEAPAEKKIEPIPVDFNVPLETSRSTLVCPLSILFERREDHGAQAAMDAHLSIFGHDEKVEKSGCQEWREGLPINLSDDGKTRAIGLKKDHNCGMLEFNQGEGLVFSCDLRNVKVDQKSTPQTQAPSQTKEVIEPQPIVVTGVYSKGQFDDCCINGSTTKRSYANLNLDSHINVGDTKDIRDIEIISISDEQILQGLTENQKLEVTCKEIADSPTAHYALPIYCDVSSIKVL